MTPSTGSAPLPPARLVVGTLILALAYAVVGRLGLLLAIPPGYATALWPPTGIALAGLIILGPRSAWGVWLGSFLVNLWVTWSGGHLSWTTALMSASIAVGAAVGAWAATWLLRRDPEWSTALERQSDILRFLFLGIPAMALVTASWGVSSLLAFGVAPASDALVNWFTWWTGDALGAMVFGPLALMLFAQPRALWQSRRYTVGLPLAGAFLLASTFFVLVRTWEGERAERARLEVVAAVETEVNEQLRDYGTVLESAAAFFASHPSVRAEEFQSFALMMRSRAPGMLAMEWAPYLSDRQVPELEAWAVRAIHPGYRVHRLSSPQVRSRLKAPVVFIEPLANNEMALGLDLNSEPGRAQGLEAAAREERTVATRAIRLVQGRPGFLLLRSAKGPIGARTQAPGVIVAVVDAVALLEQSLLPAGPKSKGARVGLWDGPGPSAALLGSVAEAGGRWRSAPAPASGQGYSRRIEQGGAQWRLEVLPQLSQERDWVLWSVLSTGALFTGLVGSLLLLVTGRARLVEDLVAERTAQLEAGRAQLLRQGRLMERTQKAARVAGWEMDPESGRVAWTTDAAALFGVAAASVPDLHAALSLLRPEHIDQVRQALDRAARQALPFELEVEAQFPDGGAHWLRLTGAAVLDGEKVTGLFGSAQDITAVKEAVRARDAFVSVVSHELRTPLTSIRGSLGLLKAGAAGELPPKARDLVELASANCERQILLVNDLLDMERVGSGKLELREVSIPLSAFLERALKEHVGYAEACQVRLALELPASPLLVRGDPDRLHQVVANLLSNACKFSPSGATVTLSCQRRGGFARISVTDRGAGVPRDFRARVFQPFAQADASDTRARGGTGLGLAITRALVERMGGRVGFDCPDSGGSVFWVELPLA